MPCSCGQVCFYFVQGIFQLIFFPICFPYCFHLRDARICHTWATCRWNFLHHPPELGARSVWPSSSAVVLALVEGRTVRMRSFLSIHTYDYYLSLWLRWAKVYYLLLWLREAEVSRSEILLLSEESIVSWLVLQISYWTSYWLLWDPSSVRLIYCILPSEITLNGEVGCSPLAWGFVLRFWCNQEADVLSWIELLRCPFFIRRKYWISPFLWVLTQGVVYSMRLFLKREVDFMF